MIRRALLLASLALLLVLPGAARADSTVLPVTGSVTVTSALGQETIALAGTATVQRGNPYLDAGRLVIDTEITAMSLSGESGGGPVSIAESASLASTGEIRGINAPPAQYPASSYFDAFITATVPASPNPTITLHNNTPIHLTGGTLTGWPPAGVAYSAQPNPCVPLLPSLPMNACLTNMSFTVGTPVGGVSELAQPSADGGGGSRSYLLIAGLAAVALAVLWPAGRLLRGGAS
jgi:hypothetical protein